MATAPCTKALAQAVAAVRHAIWVCDREGDDSGYDAKMADIMLDKGRLKHIRRRDVDASAFEAHVKSALTALES